jgi:hypothetical protein
MMTRLFPPLDDPALPATRDALHAYARVLGDWLTACRLPRKHWWQGSLRPAVRGLTTGVLHGVDDVEIELDLLLGRVWVRTSRGAELVEPLRGQPGAELAQQIAGFMTANGFDEQHRPSGDAYADRELYTATYSPNCAQTMARVWSSLTSALEELRAGIREETSAIQLWPHHFDLSMVWLPGDKIPDRDPDSVEEAENADKQMNFGFILGDDTIPEPYFYITAYPSPDALSTLRLPAGAVWQTEGFAGVTLTYRQLLTSDDPRGYLLDLWGCLLTAGHDHLQT